MSRLRLSDLARLTEMQREAALASLSAASATCAAQQAKLEQLARERQSARTDIALSGDLVDCAGAILHEQWAARKAQVLGAELAALTEIWSARRSEAATAHGRDSILDKMVESETDARRAARLKRQQANGASQ